MKIDKYQNAWNLIVFSARFLWIKPKLSFVTKLWYLSG